MAEQKPSLKRVRASSEGASTSIDPQLTRTDHELSGLLSQLACTPPQQLPSVVSQLLIFSNNIESLSHDDKLSSEDKLAVATMSYRAAEQIVEGMRKQWETAVARLDPLKLENVPYSTVDLATLQNAILNNDLKSLLAQRDEAKAIQASSSAALPLPEYLVELPTGHAQDESLTTPMPSPPASQPYQGEMEVQTPSSPSPEPISPRGIRLIYHASAGVYLFRSVGETLFRPNNNVDCGYAVLSHALEVDVDAVRDSSPRIDVLRVRPRDQRVQRLRTADLSHMAQVWQRVICVYLPDEPSRSQTYAPHRWLVAATAIEDPIGIQITQVDGGDHGPVEYWSLVTVEQDAHLPPLHVWRNNGEIAPGILERFLFWTLRQ